MKIEIVCLMNKSFADGIAYSSSKENAMDEVLEFCKEFYPKHVKSLSETGKSTERLWNGKVEEFSIEVFILDTEKLKNIIWENIKTKQ